MSSFLHHTTISLGTSLVLTLIGLQWEKFLLLKMQFLCKCFMKIYIIDSFYANFPQNQVVRTCGEFPISIIALLHRNPMVVLVWLGSCTVRARPRLREGVRVLTSMLTSGSACFLQGYAQCPNPQTQVRPVILKSHHVAGGSIVQIPSLTLSHQ